MRPYSSPLHRTSVLESTLTEVMSTPGLSFQTPMHCHESVQEGEDVPVVQNTSADTASPQLFQCLMPRSESLDCRYSEFEEKSTCVMGAGWPRHTPSRE
jgi:hypothetical protein